MDTGAMKSVPVPAAVDDTDRMPKVGRRLSNFAALAGFCHVPPASGFRAMIGAAHLPISAGGGDGGEQESRRRRGQQGQQIAAGRGDGRQ